MSAIPQSMQGCSSKYEISDARFSALTRRCRALRLRQVIGTVGRIVGDECPPVGSRGTAGQRSGKLAIGSASRHSGQVR